MPVADEKTPPKDPPYSWRCVACHSVNEAGVARCSCGLAAYASGKAIAQRAAELEPPETPIKSKDSGSWSFANDVWLFFPEGILAAITVLALPIWIGRLLYKGAFGAAAMLVALAGIGVAVCVAAWREQNKWLLYIGVLFILLGACFAL